MGVSVRVAGDGDVATLAALRRAWAEEEADDAVDGASFEDAFAAWWTDERATRTFFLAEVDGEPVGMANVKRYARMPTLGTQSEAWGYVGNVYVRADRRRHGIGAALMDAVVAWSWANGFDKLRLSPSPAAVPFYDRLGFQQSALLQLDP